MQSAREGNFSTFIRMTPPQSTKSKPSDRLLQRNKTTKKNKKKKEKATSSLRIQANKWVG